jgi:hypothetical protein
MLKSLIDETPGKRTARALQVYSPAGARGVLGGLPPGLDDPRALFAVTHAGGDTFVLVLMPQGAGWHAAGLVRR